MKKVFLINAHQPSAFSEGKLNASLLKSIESNLKTKGYEIKKTISANGYDVNEEVEKHQWADVVILQTPVNWMGVPWSFKKYMDEVYSAGMDGRLCNMDGRTRKAPKKNYGGGGVLTETKYMLSLTFNAPKEAFEDSEEYLFQGNSVDDLWFPMHMNFRFFGMQALPTFACHDVMKNPEIENDFKRLDAHLDKHF